MDARDRDQYARLDAVDDLIVDLQREMLTGAQKQAREFDDLRRSIELQKMDPPTTSAATKAKAIGAGIASLIVTLIAAAIQNGWFTEPKPKDPANLPIPVSTYQ
jgi:hypothetical protein